MQVAGQQSKIKGASISRDADGNPKIGKEAAVKAWPKLNIKDKEYLKNKFSLNLEIK